MVNDEKLIGEVAAHVTLADAPSCSVVRKWSIISRCRLACRCSDSGTAIFVPTSIILDSLIYSKVADVRVARA